jgi:hypothetical protein
MKTIYTLLLFAFMALFHVRVDAAVITVSNVTSRPAQHSSLQAAVDAASPGDTLLITGGGGNYGSVIMVKTLVLIGEGIRNTPVMMDYLYLQKYSPTMGSDSSRFYGLNMHQVNINGDFTGAAGGQRSMNNFIFERCVVREWAALHEGPETIRDIIFRHCLFGVGVMLKPDVDNVLLTNCVFNGAGIFLYNACNGSNLNSEVVVSNSIFLNRTSRVFGSHHHWCGDLLRGLVLENNIFYRSEPTGCYDCYWYNNLTYANAQVSALPPPGYGGTGSGNLENLDPLFNNFPFNFSNPNAEFSWGHNYGLQTGSPALGTGTNGTNIGLWGGLYAVTQLPSEPKTPAVTELSIPVSTVPVGGTLQINLRAVSRD